MPHSLKSAPFPPPPPPLGVPATASASSPAVSVVRVLEDSPSSAYDVTIGHGILGDLPAELRRLAPKASVFVVVTDDVVWNLHWPTLCAIFKGADWAVREFPPPRASSASTASTTTTTASQQAAASITVSPTEHSTCPTSASSSASSSASLALSLAAAAGDLLGMPIGRSHHVTSDDIGIHSADVDTDSDECGDLISEHGLLVDAERHADALVNAAAGRPAVVGARSYLHSEKVGTPPLLALLRPLDKHAANVDVLARQTKCLSRLVGLVETLLHPQEPSNHGAEKATASTLRSASSTVVSRVFLALRSFFRWTVPADVLSELYKMLRHCWCGEGVNAHGSTEVGVLAGKIENEILTLLAVIASKLRHAPVEPAATTTGSSSSAASRDAALRLRVTPCTPTSFLDPLPASYVRLRMNAQSQQEKLGRGIILPAMPWPRQGFSCSAWINVESQASGPKQSGRKGHIGRAQHVGGMAVVTEQRMMRECVFKVRTESGAGFELVREGNALIYTVYTAHGGIGDAFRGIRIFNRDFDKIDHYKAGRLRTNTNGELLEGQWHLVTICHRRPRVGRATAEIYIDGLIAADGPLAYPAWDSTPISKAFVGGVVASIMERESSKIALNASQSDGPLHSLRGRIGPFAVFNRSLTRKETAALAHHGIALLCGVGAGGPPLSAYQCRFDPSCIADARTQLQNQVQQQQQLEQQHLQRANALSRSESMRDAGFGLDSLDEEDLHVRMENLATCWLHTQNINDAGGNQIALAPAVIHYYQACRVTPLPQAIFACGGVMDLVTLLAPPAIASDGAPNGESELESGSVRDRSRARTQSNGSTSQDRSRAHSSSSLQSASSTAVEADEVADAAARQANEEVQQVLNQRSQSFSASVFDAEMRPLHWAPRRRAIVNVCKPSLSPVEFASLISTIALLVKHSAALHRSFMAARGCNLVAAAIRRRQSVGVEAVNAAKLMVSSVKLNQAEHRSAAQALFFDLSVWDQADLKAKRLVVLLSRQSTSDRGPKYFRQGCVTVNMVLQATRRWFRGRGLRTQFRGVITSLATKQALNGASDNRSGPQSAIDNPSLALCAEIARFLSQLFAQHMRSDLKGAPQLVAAGAVKAAAAKLSYLSPSKADAAKRHNHEAPKSTSKAAHFDDEATPPTANAAVAAAVASATPSSSAAAKRDSKGRARKGSQHTKVVDALYHTLLYVSEKSASVDERAFLLELILELCGVPWLLPHTTRTPHLFRPTAPLLAHEDVTPAMQLVAQQGLFLLKDLGWICSILDIGLVGFPDDTDAHIEARMTAASNADGPLYLLDERALAMDLVTKSLQLLLISCKRPHHASHLAHLRKYWIENGTPERRRTILTSCTKVAGLRVDLSLRAQAQATQRASDEAGIKDFDFGLDHGFSRLLHKSLAIVSELLEMNAESMSGGPIISLAHPPGVDGFLYFLCSRLGFSFLDKSSFQQSAVNSAKVTVLNRSFLSLWLTSAGQSAVHASCRWHALFMLAQALRMFQLSNKVVEFTSPTYPEDDFIGGESDEGTDVDGSECTTAGGREHTRLDNAWTAAAVADASDLLQIEAMSRFATNDASSSELSSLAASVVHVSQWIVKVLQIAVPPSLVPAAHAAPDMAGWHWDDSEHGDRDFVYVRGSSSMLLKFALHVVARTLVVLAINSRTVHRINHYVESTLQAIATVASQIRHQQRQRFDVLQRHHNTIGIHAARPGSVLADDDPTGIAAQVEADVQFYTAFFFKALLTQLLAVHLTFQPPKPPEQEERQSVSSLLKSSLVLGETSDPRKKLKQITVRLHQTFLANSINVVSIVANEAYRGCLAQHSITPNRANDDGGRDSSGVTAAMQLARRHLVALLAKFGTTIFRERVQQFLSHGGPFLAEDSAARGSKSRPAAPPPPSTDGDDVAAMSDATTSKPAFEASIPDAAIDTPVNVVNAKVVRRLETAGDIVVSLFRLSLEEIDECINRGGSVQLYPSLIQAWIADPNSNNSGIAAGSGDPEVQVKRVVNAQSVRTAEILQWLCPQLCSRLLSSWKAKRQAITKFLQLQLRRFVATPFKDMQSLLQIMKGHVFQRALVEMRGRDENILTNLQQFRSWLSRQVERKKATRLAVQQRFRSVQAEANYFWLATRQHLCRKWLHSSKKLASLLWETYCRPGGLWSAGRASTRAGLPLLPKGGESRGIGGTYEDWMLRHASSVLMQEQTTSTNGETSRGSSKPSTPQRNQSRSGRGILDSPTVSSGLIPASATPASQQRTRAAATMLKKAAASGRLGFDSASTILETGRVATHHSSHRVRNEVTTHIVRLRPARSATTRAPCLLGFEPTFASGIGDSKTAADIAALVFGDGLHISSDLASEFDDAAVNFNESEFFSRTAEDGEAKPRSSSAMNEDATLEKRQALEAILRRNADAANKARDMELFAHPGDAPPAISDTETEEDSDNDIAGDDDNDDDEDVDLPAPPSPGGGGAGEADESITDLNVAPTADEMNVEDDGDGHDDIEFVQTRLQPDAIISDLTPVRDSASDGEVVVLSGPGANAKALDTTTSSTTGIGAKFRGFVRAAQDVIDNVKSGQSVGQAMSNAVVGQATNQRQHKPSMIQTDGRGVLYIGRRKFSSLDPSLAGLKFSDHKAFDRYIRKRSAQSFTVSGSDGSAWETSLKLAVECDLIHAGSGPMQGTLEVTDSIIRFVAFSQSKESPHTQAATRVLSKLESKLQAQERQQLLQAQHSPNPVALKLQSGESSAELEMRARYENGIAYLAGLNAIHEHYLQWDLAELSEVQARRHLLQRSAVELFFVDGTSVLLDMYTEEQIRRWFLNLRHFDAAARLRKHPLCKRSALLKPSAIVAVSGWTEAWRTRQLSNFEYLMKLNFAAGRTYNDLNQYPVFPWILADYKSSTLDLSNPKTFRDLRKPVGALDAERLELLRERYASLAETEGEAGGMPAFMYGSHYSNIGAVTFFLLRMEPYFTYAIEMQGGYLDVADRLFSSVASAWDNVQKSSSDVKELVPEFFYLPDAFCNRSMRLPLGACQNGERVDDVVLPPWAGGSAHEFVRLHRAALESDYVSARLHHWVDLVFGYQQRGKPAVQADNVFYHLTYEGAVDVREIANTFEREAVETQITAFGQTPSQLFTSPHPKRMSTMELVAERFPRSFEKVRRFLVC
eukprot:INCI7214.1.p1 GENE.INCI7214.1~~INCI7214.1.p1  ORF type:complete len:3202 (-),score=518.53 INCI7214.1:3391-12840(-)